MFRRIRQLFSKRDRLYEALNELEARVEHLEWLLQELAKYAKK